MHTYNVFKVAFTTTICLILNNGLAFSLDELIDVKVIFYNCENDESVFYGGTLTAISESGRRVEDIQPYYGVYKFKAPKGRLVLKFENLFKQMTEQEYQVKGPGKSKIKPCFDELVDVDLVTISEKLREGGKLSIKASSSGCFHSSSTTYVFYLEKKLIAEMYSQNNILKKRKRLNIEAVNELIKFEQKARLMKQDFGGCTTTDTYVFQLDGQEFRLEDSSCEWNAVDWLYRRFF